MDRMVLSIAFTDYLHESGGTAKFIKEQQKYCNECGISYLYIYPHKTKGETKSLWGVILDGRFVRIFDDKSIFQLIRNNIYQISSVIVNHISKTDIETLKEILSLTEWTVFFYLHDYYLICKSTQFIKNDKNLCEHKRLNEKMCGECCYYNESLEIREFLKQISSKNRTLFIAPSEATRKIFINAYPEYSTETYVVPHFNFKTQMIEKKRNAPIRVAYVGAQNYIKGWETYEKLVKQLENDERYEFYSFGKNKIHNNSIICVEADFKKNNQKMEDQLINSGIDVSILWSIWPETYSYTYFESYKAGCFIITNTESGNISSQIKNNKNGIVFDNENSLIESFKSGHIIQVLDEYITDGINVPIELENNSSLVEMFDVRANTNKGIHVIYSETHDKVIKKIMYLCKRWIMKLFL